MIALIFRSAFSDTEAAGAFLGGSIGIAFSMGMKRALFSNEAGLGSAPIAHAAAKTGESAREGVVGGLGPFIDTICICTLTALVIIATGTWNRGPIGNMSGETELIINGDKVELKISTKVNDLPQLPYREEWTPGTRVFLLVGVPDSDSNEIKRKKIIGTISNEQGYIKKVEWEPPPGGAQWVIGDDGKPIRGVFRDFAGATLTGHAFDRAFPGLGKWLVTLAAWLFAVSTMISWSYYGEQGVFYMLGKNWIMPYKIAFLILAIIGAVSVQSNQQLGDLADFGTGWMLWANMLIVITMGRLAVKSLDDYFKRLKSGEFHPHKRPSFTDVVEGKDVE